MSLAEIDWLKRFVFAVSIHQNTPAREDDFGFRRELRGSKQCALVIMQPLVVEVAPEIRVSRSGGWRLKNPTQYSNSSIPASPCKIMSEISCFHPGGGG